MRSYEAARRMFNVQEFISWAVILLGAIVAFGGATVGGAFGPAAGGIQAIIAAVPGLVLSLAGIYGLAFVQISRAGVDSAEYAQQSLKIAREQLEISREAQLRARAQPIAYPVSKPAAEDGSKGAPAPSEEVGGASYADRRASPEATHIEDQPNAQALESSNPNALAFTPSVPLVDVSEQISYNSGKYFVAGKKFWSRSEAEAYAREQL